MRTTSSVESMHAVFGRTFPRRPNIFNFIENLRQFEFSKFDRIGQLIDGDEMPRVRREKDRKRDEKINRQSTLLANKMISMEEFLDMMATDNEESDESEESYESDETDESFTSSE